MATKKKAAARMKQATELEFLIWFYQNCDFGPAHGDVMVCMFDDFKEQSGKELPEGYADGYEQ